VRRPQYCRLLLHHRWAGKKAGLLFCNLPKHRQAAAPRSHASSRKTAGDREGVLSMLRLHEHHAFLQTSDYGPCHVWTSYAMHTAVPLCAASGVLSCSVKCQLCRLRRRGGNRGLWEVWSSVRRHPVRLIVGTWMQAKCYLLRACLTSNPCHVLARPNPSGARRHGRI
jgi:hypothetical protein